MNAQEVKVLGDFNNWSTADACSMKVSGAEYQAVIELETGRNYQFRYLVDNCKWMNDGQADAYMPNPFGVENSVVVLPKVEGIPMNADAKTVMTEKTVDAPVTTKKTVTTRTTKNTEKPVATTTAVTEKPATTAKKVTKKNEKVVATTKKAVKTTAKVAKTSKKATKKVKTPKEGDFKQIEGIGPKIMSILQAAGIKTYAALAATPIAEIKELLLNAGSRYKMHDPTTWPQQAKMAAAGKWEALKKWQGELKGGKPA